MKYVRAAVFVLLLCLPVTVWGGAQTCTYSDWTWHSKSAKAVDYRTVITTRDQLTPGQQHPELPCSICSEDQREILLPGLEPFSVCRIFANDIEQALKMAMDEGFQINSVTGYRVGKTKGPLDGDGLRTQYSHHSFGVALDINADQNGLYDQCVRFSPRTCRRVRGGHWRPNTPGTVTPNSPVYQHLVNRVGLKWGGELAGRQKDFMHFSPGGD